MVQGFQGLPGYPGPVGERGPSGPVGPTVRTEGPTETQSSCFYIWLFVSYAHVCLTLQGLPGNKGERGEKVGNWYKIHISHHVMFHPGPVLAIHVP